MARLVFAARGLAALVGLVFGVSISASYVRSARVSRGSRARALNVVYLLLAVVAVLAIALIVGWGALGAGRRSMLAEVCQPAFHSQKGRPT
jgi:hypothetical protein